MIFYHRLFLLEKAATIQRLIPLYSHLQTIKEKWIQRYQMTVVLTSILENKIPWLVKPKKSNL